ncbi:MAG: DnaJ domain-containing protein [Haloarculaceae archaeon]
MGETFYSLLDVDADADRETIRNAYRDLVKGCHPDVSDDPAAPDQFRQLTTVRDVLLDEAERDRYDRLGHDAYVHRHVDTGVWTAEASAEATASGGAPEERDRASRSARASTRDSTRTTENRTAWLGEGGPSRGSRRSRTRGRRAGAATGGAQTGWGWQHDSGVYERVETDIDEPTYADRILGGIRAVGPWLAVHFVFILSALATGWFTYTQASRSFEPSVLAIVFGLFVIGLVVSVSIFHLVSQLYT